jgi:hypothetical protein
MKTLPPPDPARGGGIYQANSFGGKNVFRIIKKNMEIVEEKGRNRKYTGNGKETLRQTRRCGAKWVRRRTHPTGEKIISHAVRRGFHPKIKTPNRAFTVAGYRPLQPSP